MKKLKLYGNADSSEIYPIRDFLKRSVVDFEWSEITYAHPGQQNINSYHPDTYAVIEFPDGQTIVNPTLEQIARNLGWITNQNMKNTTFLSMVLVLQD